jgi:rhamnosyltransferase
MTSNCAPRPDYAIGLVLYHPEESLLKRVDLMLQLGYRVYIFDNSPFNASSRIDIQNHRDVVYLTAGKNVGIGFSLSMLCATAYVDGYERLFFLDQDTGISGETLDFVSNFSKSLPVDVRRQYALFVFKCDRSPDQIVEDVRFAISSGSLFNLQILKQIGWHNEKYFVDCVDYELCLRARRSGFRIGLIKNIPDFDHITEQPDREINLIGKRLLVRRYTYSRIKDALSAYIKLIFGGIFKNHINDTLALAKSMGLYIFGQIVSRFIQEKRQK